MYEKKENVLQIRNSTIDFLVFTKQNSEDGIEVRVQDESVWLTQDGISRLFDKGRTTITEHLKHIFVDGELEEDAVCRKFRHTASDGKEYKTKYYNLDAIISVGYRVNSLRATQFRQWATKLDVFLELNEEVILQGKGGVTAEIARAFAESEFEKYRAIQDKEYQSDFHRLLEEM